MPALDVRKLIQELVVPELHEIKSDIKVIDSRIDSLNSRIDSLEREMDARFNAVDKRLDSLEGQIVTAIAIHERLAAVEAKLNLSR